MTCRCPQHAHRLAGAVADHRHCAADKPTRQVRPCEMGFDTIYQKAVVGREAGKQDAQASCGVSLASFTPSCLMAFDWAGLSHSLCAPCEQPLAMRRWRMRQHKSLHRSVARGDACITLRTCNGHAAGAQSCHHGAGRYRYGRTNGTRRCWV